MSSRGGGDNNNFSRSSGARGRIQQVLAQARASLKEPSRPYTPSSLDERTTLDSVLGTSNGMGGGVGGSGSGRSGIGRANSLGQNSYNGGGGSNSGYSSGSSAIQGATIVHKMLKENFRNQPNSHLMSSSMNSYPQSSPTSTGSSPDGQLDDSTHSSPRSSVRRSTSGNRVSSKHANQSEDIPSEYDDNNYGDSNGGRALCSTSSRSRSGSSSSSGASNFRLFLKDVKDLISSLDFASIEDVSTASNSRIEELINMLVAKVDKLAKAIKSSGRQLDSDSKQEIETVVGALLTTVALRLVDRELGTTSKLHLLRSLLRFYLACLTGNYTGVLLPPTGYYSAGPDDPLKDVSAIPSGAPGSRLDYFTALGLKKIAQGLYQVRVRGQQGHLDGAAGAAEPELKRQPSRKNSRSSVDSTEDIAASTSASGASLMTGDTLSLGGSEALIDLLAACWLRLPVATENELNTLLDTIPSHNNNNNSSSISSSRSIRSRISGKSQGPGADSGESKEERNINPAFISLLESAAFAAAVLRSVSNTETDRRRLVHCAAIETIANGLHFIETNRPLRAALKARHTQLQHEQQLQQLQAEGDNKDDDDSDRGASAISKGALGSSNTALAVIVDKFVLLLVQLLGTVRNFALDGLGRRQLLSQEVVRRLCTMQRIFHGHPDVLLNCARVTAKLSLLDPFRAQINSKPSNIKCLVDVVVGEAAQCNHIMEGNLTERISRGGGGGDRESDNAPDMVVLGGEWPSWHTWPMLSRICFTLGNLTTTNERNRKIIGVECKIVPSLVLLLQACAGSLTQLSSNASAKELQRQERSKEQLKPSSKNSRRRRRQDSRSQGGEGGQGDASGSASTAAIAPEDRHVSRADFRACGRASAGASARNDDDDDDDDEEEEEEEEEEDSSGEGKGEDSEDDGEDQEDDDDDDDDGAAEQELRDATIKLLRLLANLSIDPDVGAALAARGETLSILLELFISAGDQEDREEMLLNVIAACTNVSFYTGQYMKEFEARQIQQGTEEQQDQDYVQQQIAPQELRAVRKIDRQLVALCKHLSFCLFHSNDEIVLETARVLGNLTQHASVRSSLIANRTDEALVLLLEHVNGDILSAVTGTLVNISADPQCKSALLKPSSSLLSAFSDLLRRVSFKDIMLSTLICQVLHNLLSSPYGGGGYSLLGAIADGADGGGGIGGRYRGGAAGSDGHGHGGSLNYDGSTDHGGTVVSASAPGDRHPAEVATEAIHASLVELSECANDLKVDEMDAYATFERVASAVITLLEV